MSRFRVKVTKLPTSGDEVASIVDDKVGAVVQYFKKSQSGDQYLAFAEEDCAQRNAADQV